MSDCDGETLTIEVEGAPDEHYADLLAQATLKAESRLPGAIIHRSQSDCDGDGEEWFLGCGHAHLPGVGTKMEGVFTFVRRT